MKVLILLVVIACVLALNDNDDDFKYENRYGHCEPFTIDVLARLARKEARHIRDPNLRPKEKNLRYDLFTHLNPKKRQQLKLGNRDMLLKSNFNNSWPVRFSLHGWTGTSTTCSNAAIKDAYVSRGNYNIILVDWSDYSTDIIYPRLVSEVLEISRKLNEFTRFLHRAAGIAYKDMYLIGHSLGCHIAGIAGKLLKPDKYGVIYALDTAGPIHMGFNETWRLAPSDALYVESIQTNVALFGFPGAHFAHASFFPNWGMGQPHCPDVTPMEPDFACEHFSALYYFVESVRNGKAFGAVKCTDYKNVRQQKCGCGRNKCKAEVYMGGDPAVPKSGVYYLSTRKTMPFGYGDVCKIQPALVPGFLRLT